MPDGDAITLIGVGTDGANFAHHEWRNPHEQRLVFILYQQRDAQC